MKFWYKKSFLCFLLWPFSLLYRFVIFVRKSFYRLGIFKTTQFKIPVIVIGNINVGGVGKTPVVAALAKQLQQQGRKVGLVSRGYGGKAKVWPQVVSKGSDPALVGDEPVMLVQQTGCPMVVGPNRVEAVQQLINNFKPDVILSDDGLQHLAMGRSFEIVVVDGERQFGNGMCLPAGPLREPVSRLKSVDAVIEINWALPQAHAGASQTRHEPILGGSSSAVHASHGLFSACPRLGTPTSLVDQAPLSKAHSQVHAVAGIGHPDKFFNRLREQGLDIIEHPFPDHHQYKASDLDFGDDLPILMTAKDAVKVVAFIDSRFYVVPLEVQLPSSFLTLLNSPALRG